MDREAARIAGDFAKKVKKRYSPVKVILFGSRARGDHFKHSDYDFLIISEKFKNKNFLTRASGLYDFWDNSVDLEALCFTPKEFERKKKQIGIVQQASKEGIEF